ncbi:MAG TPA: DUF1501 domain-containing protein [Gemmataceae bacterium]|jgi:hypothetical protein|nr:DUF1501 domain-containing protein [Gemmataceae bacterium]
MLRILGSRKQFCDGLTRRDLLHVGALGPLGLSLAGYAAAREKAVATPEVGGFGKAKRVILLYLWGSPSQHETWDPKPNSPVETRGELNSIATAIPGVRIGEIFPQTAKILDRVTVLRSLTHPFPIHGTSFALTSVPFTDLTLESVHRDSRQWPFVGSVIDHLAERNGARTDVPRNLFLPFFFGSRRGPPRSGPFGAFLGPAYDPVAVNFPAQGAREVERASGIGEPRKLIADPYAGILPTDRFDLGAPPTDMTIDRLDGRASLLDQLDDQRRQAESDGGFDRHRTMARSVLTSGKLRDALDVQREPATLRERYGMTLFGQSCLAARRLLEAGGTFVTVCWDEYGLVNTGWDTHVYHYPRLRGELGPGFDKAFTALLLDLESRGMLNDTAVLAMSEHGRTPAIQKAPGGGRDHWSRAYSAAFAGGGFGAGRVVGRTDKQAGTVAETPFSPKDVLATLYHLLGIDPHTEIRDRLGRPVPVGGEGRVRAELLA